MFMYTPYNCFHIAIFSLLLPFKLNWQIAGWVCSIHLWVDLPEFCNKLLILVGQDFELICMLWWLFQLSLYWWLLNYHIRCSHLLLQFYWCNFFIVVYLLRWYKIYSGLLINIWCGLACFWKFLERYQALV